MRNTSGLLLTGRGNLGHDITHLLDGGDDLSEHLAGLIHQPRPSFDLVDTVDDQRLNLFGRIRAMLRQLAYLSSDDGKAAPLFPGARCFDSSVEGQEIGLKSDAINDTGNISDLFAAVADVCHSRHRLADHLTPLLGLGARVSGQLIGLACVVGVLFHRAVHFFHAGCRLFQGGGLFLRALAQFSVALHNLTRRIRDIARRLSNLPDDLTQLLAHALHGLQ